jgi:hypothetical protein
VDGSHQQEQTQRQADTSQPAAPIPCASEVCKENAENAERYTYYKAHPKEYLKAAIAPANLSNWILAALGAIGVLGAILTLVVIKRQVVLQGAAMQQWVDVETRGVSVKTTWNKPFTLELQFEAVNNTPFLLTINKIVTTVALWCDAWEEFTVETWDRLPPAKDGKISGHCFYIETSMATKEEFEKVTLFTMTHKITFTDCLGKKRTQWFSGHYDCGPDRLERMGYMGIVPDKQEHKYDPRAQQGWFTRAMQKFKQPPKPN